MRYSGGVLEIVILLLALMLAPQQGIWLPVICLGAILFCVPGAYATWFGAPFLPTAEPLVRRMVEAAGLKPGQTVYDLGCGDGRILLAAAEHGVTAIGYELSLPMYAYCKLRCLLHRNIRVRLGDFWRQRYADADVIFCYLLTDTMKTFEKVVWPQLKPGCRVVSHSFKMPTIAPTSDAEKIVIYVKP